MIQSSSGDFWFATKTGVSRFDGTIWTDYTKSNGIANKIVT